MWFHSTNSINQFTIDKPSSSSSCQRIPENSAPRRTRPKPKLGPTENSAPHYRGELGPRCVELGPTDQVLIWSTWLYNIRTSHHCIHFHIPGGALPLWESVGMRRGFAPHFRHLDDLFAPQNLTMSTISFRSCWVPFRSPTFSACRRSFCPPNWPNLSFYSDLVGSRFELRAPHPYWFWPGVPPPPPPRFHIQIKCWSTFWKSNLKCE